jgi:N-acetylglucosaminyldiphosphoundecaprenol N-acetyl-beta-D-mannosaminyltransferase
MMSALASSLPPRFKVLSAGISAITLEACVTKILAMVERREKGYVNVCTVHTMLECVDRPQVAEIVNHSTLSVPDGMPLVWLGKHNAEGVSVDRCYGPDLMLGVCRSGLEKGVRHGLYGATPAVLEVLEQNLRGMFPRIEIVCAISPPFRELSADEEREMASKINAAHPDVVWVGLGTPKQDLCLGAFRPILEAPVLIAVGAAFNFHAGKVAQAPRWMMRCGLEWAFRLLKEPRRLWRRYLLGNPRFVSLLLLQRYKEWRAIRGARCEH